MQRIIATDVSNRVAVEYHRVIPFLSPPISEIYRELLYRYTSWNPDMGEEMRQEWMDTELVSIAVVSKVAEREGTSPTDLPPLQNVVDSDALDALFSDDEEGNIELDFRYSSHEVHISGGDEPQVRLE